MLVSGFELLFELSAPLLYSESDDWGADSITWFTSRIAIEFNVNKFRLSKIKRTGFK